MLRFLDEAILRLSRWLGILAGFAMLAIAAIIMLEVVMRALRNPLIGGIEMTRIAFVFSVFFAFAYVTTTEREIRVDAFRHKMPPLLVKVLDAAAALTTAVFFALFFWLGLAKTDEAWERGIFLEGQLLLPMWIPWGAVVIGSLLAVLACLRSMVRVLVEPPKVDSGTISAATRQVS
jgi:TRAP-type C4-dicarboxylate transport system permease small subunit